MDEWFASTRPEAHAAAGREVRARRTLESVCVPARRQARADALSAAVTPTTTERWPSRTLGVAAPSTERVGRQRLPPTVVHALAAVNLFGFRDDVRVARRGAHERAVDAGLRRLVRDGHVLVAGVPVPARRVDLPADLVEVEPKPHESRGLRSAREGVPDRLLDAVEVDEPRVRPRVAPVERIGRAIRVGMEAQAVHQRPGAPALPVPRAERPEKPNG